MVTKKRLVEIVDDSLDTENLEFAFYEAGFNSLSSGTIHTNPEAYRNKLYDNFSNLSMRAKKELLLDIKKQLKHCSYWELKTSKEKFLGFSKDLLNKLIT